MYICRFCLLFFLLCTPGMFFRFVIPVGAHSELLKVVGAPKVLPQCRRGQFVISVKEEHDFDLFLWIMQMVAKLVRVIWPQVPVVCELKPLLVYVQCAWSVGIQTPSLALQEFGIKQIC